PLQSANSMTIDMQYGSPFTYFTKKGPLSGAALAKLWIAGATPDGSKAYEIWNVGLPANVLGITITTFDQDPSNTGVNRLNVSSYLVIAQDANHSPWQMNMAEMNKTGYPTNSNATFTNTMASGTIVVVTLPHFVGSTPLESLSPQDKLAIANLF